MIIKNEYVKIKSDKEIILKNYIYDIYLELLAQSQYKKEIKYFSMLKCYLKFDESFETITNKEPQDFDICIEATYIDSNGSKSKVEINYMYSPMALHVHDAKTGEFINDLTPYYDKKITAIGFGNKVDNIEKIFSCIDTKEYSIYFKENISFSRKDIIETDTISTDDFPENLLPFGNKYIIEDTGRGIMKYPCYSVLYSIGLGTTIGEMREEYIIGEDIDIIEESSTSFGFNVRKGVELTKHPHQSLYTNNIYPLPLKVNKEIFPTRKTYSKNSIFPMSSDYKYIIYKYRRYYYDDFMAQPYVFLDEYFTINLPNETKGLFEIVTKIERSDV